MTLADFLADLRPFARYQSRRLAFLFRRLRVEADDLYQEGMIAAVVMHARFDQSLGLRPLSYARHRVRGAMIDFIRDRGDEFGRGHFRRVASGEAAARVSYHEAEVMEEMFGRLGDEPSDGEVAEFRAAVASLGAGLTPAEVELLVERYVGGSQLKEIGTRRGLSESRVSQLHTRMIDTIRERAREQGWTELTTFAAR